LLEKNPDKIYWECLSANPSAIHLLENNPDKINWDWLSANSSAIHLLKKNPDKINWYMLSQNPSECAIQLLKKNQEEIHWSNLSKNPYIFNYNYIQMKHNCMLFKEDLMKNRLHPRNISKFRHWKVNGFEFDSD